MSCGKITDARVEQLRDIQDRHGEMKEKRKEEQGKLEEKKKELEKLHEQLEKLNDMINIEEEQLIVAATSSSHMARGNEMASPSKAH